MVAHERHGGRGERSDAQARDADTIAGIRGLDVFAHPCERLSPYSHPCEIFKRNAKENRSSRVITSGITLAQLIHRGGNPSRFWLSRGGFIVGPVGGGYVKNCTANMPYNGALCHWLCETCYDFSRLQIPASAFRSFKLWVRSTGRLLILVCYSSLNSRKKRSACQQN